MLISKVAESCLRSRAFSQNECVLVVRFKMFAELKTYISWWSTWRARPVRDWIRAASSYRAGNYDRAAAQYQQGLSRFPNHPAAENARLDLAFCLFQLRRLREAQGLLAEVIRSNPVTREPRIRLARLHLWSGEVLKAASVAEIAMKELGTDPEFVALFLFAALEHEQDRALIDQGIKLLEELSREEQNEPLVQVVQAKLHLVNLRDDLAFELLADLVDRPQAPFDGVVLYGELLLQRGVFTEGRYHLQRALKVAPSHPKVLGLLAESYLVEGGFFNPDFAVQLAQAACQSSGWLNPRELHILAEAYRLRGDNVAALLAAAKAQDITQRYALDYQRADRLDILVAELASGTLQ